MVYKLFWISLVAFSMSILSCSTEDAPRADESSAGSERCEEVGETSEEASSNERVDIILDAPQKVALQSTNNFGFDVTAATLGHLPDDQDNLVFSPLSLSMALSMVANASEDQTLDEILAVLGYRADELGAVNTLNARLMEHLPAIDNSTAVALANAVWSDQRFGELDAEFSKNLLDFYQADAVALPDLNSPEAMEIINNWCSDKTKGLIPKIFDKPLENVVFVLANATYFKGLWSEEFSKADTKKMKFQNFNGTSSSVKMMRAIRSGKHFSSNSYNALRLDYGNRAFSFTIVLPNEGVSLKECLEDAKNDLAGIDASEKFTLKNVGMALPIFEVSSSLDLMEMLQSLGLNKVFTCESEVNHIYENGKPCVIEKICQKSTFGIDEKGAEAASVTHTSIFTSPGPEPKDEVEFIVNRPFLFLVTEQSSGAIIFTGAIRKL